MSSTSRASTSVSSTSVSSTTSVSVSVSANKQIITQQARDYIEWVNVQLDQRRCELLHGVLAYLLQPDVKDVISQPQYTHFRRLLLCRIDEYHKLVKDVPAQFTRLETEMEEFICACDCEYYYCIRPVSSHRFSARMKNKIYQAFDAEYRKGLAAPIYS